MESERVQMESATGELWLKLSFLVERAIRLAREQRIGDFGGRWWDLFWARWVRGASRACKGHRQVEVWVWSSSRELECRCDVHWYQYWFELKPREWMRSLRESQGNEKKEDRDGIGGILHLNWYLWNFVPWALKLLSRCLKKKLESQVDSLCENASRKSERIWRKNTFKDALQESRMRNGNKHEGGRHRPYSSTLIFGQMEEIKSISYLKWQMIKVTLCHFRMTPTPQYDF